jgi:outer membrane protein assembly factor BamB
MKARLIAPVLAWLAWLAADAVQCGIAEDWHQFRGPDGQAISRNRALPTTWSATQNIVWRTELPGPGASSPIVLGERIYVTCFTGYAVPGSSGGDINALQRHVLCLQRTDGKILWQKDLPAAQPEQASVRDHGYASSTPLADADRLYVFLGKSGVFAFGHDGKKLWQAGVGSKVHGWGSASSPVLYKDLVIINASVESDSLVALNKQTGQEIWKAGGINESWNTPILVPVTGGRRELVVAIAGKVLGFDPATGEQLWSCATGIGWYMVPSMVNDGDVVYCIGGRSGGSLAIRAGGSGDVTQSHRLWTLTKGSNVSSPVFHEGHVYFLHENTGIVNCVEAATGRLVFEERLAKAGQLYSSPILVDGKLYCVGRQGTVFVLAARPQFEQLARNEMGDRSNFDASPAVDGSRLLIRSDKFVYCIGAN